MTKVTEKDLGCGVTNNNPVKIGISYIEYTRDLCALTRESLLLIATVPLIDSQEDYVGCKIDICRDQCMS